jgi:two-component system C4-dicarboxylate transport sensor histidine kinase DctB
MEQVVVNLILNALDAVEGRGDGRVSVTVESDGVEARLVVRDTGVGISPDILPRVAEPFFSTKSAAEGLGIGLSICKAILAEFGGKLSVASALGRGTTVTVVLPAAALAQAAAE